MKRELSSSPIPSSSDLDTPPKKARKPIASSPSTPGADPTSRAIKKVSTPKSTASPCGGWSREKREALIDELLSAGMKAVKPADIAAKVGITPQPYKDATQSGKNNLRAKTIRAAGGLGK